MTTIQQRLRHLERQQYAERMAALDSIPAATTPPTQAELLRLKQELAIPDAVFSDLFREPPGPLPTGRR